MVNKDFKKQFGVLAKSNEFKNAFGGWYKESAECIVVLELQKSNFGYYYQLLIKIFIQGAFNRTYTIDRKLIKSSMGHVTTNETSNYTAVLDINEPMDDSVRKELLGELYQNHIVPLTDRALTRNGIKELAKNGEIFLLPAVKRELE
jgi:hypothetical protein